MGVGPRYAIPKLLNLAGLKVDDIGVWEVNEAFASQALYCLRELGIDKYMDESMFTAARLLWVIPWNARAQNSAHSWFTA